jgi:hypothetical protein
MNVSTENSTEKSLEQVSGNKPVSVYSVKFTKVINNFAGKSIIQKKPSNQSVAQKSFTQKVFRWRNAAAIAAILTIGVLHFVLQVSFIRSEVSENLPVMEVPPVKTESLRAAPVETGATNIELKKIDAAVPSNSMRVARQRQSEPAAVTPSSKPQPKKREATDSRAARLRRAEKILTGV